MINKGLIEMHAIALEKIKKEEDKNMSINKWANGISRFFLTTKRDF